MYCPDGYHLHHWSYRFEHWRDVFAIPPKMHARLHGTLVYDPAAMCFRVRRADGLPGALLDTKPKHRAHLERVLNVPANDGPPDAFAAHRGAPRA
ncbi:MAG TPA: hypothetical protein VD962_09850 [Rubricoccaceae bacterium]|nr:hypothetical protein [Rubricoccaceae bacterium]